MYWKQCDLVFCINIMEFLVIGELYVWCIWYIEYSFIFFYFYGGVGLFYFNFCREVDGEWIEFQLLGIEGQGILGYV